jgi:hypothetical protein
MPLAALFVAAACGSGARGGKGPAAPAGGLSITGEEQTVYHTHGGKGAMVSSVSLLVKNPGADAHTLRVTGVERLHGPCNADGWDDARALVVHEPADAVTIQGGEETRVAVVFEPVECYNACDRFAFRVKLDVDGAAREVVSSLIVEREEPAP